MPDRNLQEILIGATEVLSSFTDLNSMVERLARLGLPLLGDWAIVNVMSGGNLYALGAAHCDPSKEALIEELKTNWSLDLNASEGIPKVLRTGKPALYSNVTPEMLTTTAPNRPVGASTEAHLKILRELGMSSFMILPIMRDGNVIGVIGFCSSTNPNRYGNTELEIGERIAKLCSLVIEKSLLYDERMESERRSLKYAERMRIIADAAHAFASAGLNLTTVLDKISHQIVEALGNGCTIRLISQDELTLEPAAFHHSNPNAIEVLRIILHESSHLMGEGLAGKVAVSGKSEIVTKIGPEDVKNMLKKEHWVFLDRYRIHSLIVVPLRLKNKIIGTISVYRDDTPESFTTEDMHFTQAFAGHAAQAIENARLYKFSQDAIRVREDFLLMATHELNTPLTSLVLGMQTLSRMNEKHTDHKPEQFSKMLNIIEGQTAKLRKIVQTLVNFLKAESGRIELKQENINLKSLVLDVATHFVPQLETSGSTIVYETMEDVTGHWDHFWLEEIISNLIGNAIKYGAGKAIRINVKKSGRSASFSIKDQGIGIEESKLELIFEPFERAVSVKNYGGFGIGLYIVKKMTEQMGGNIHVISDPGLGSTFSIHLPINQ